MLLKKPLAILILSLANSILYADTVPVYPPPPAGTLQVGSMGKKAGDIISLQTDADIASLCDFTKQIVVTRTSILCVYNGKKTATSY